MGSILLPGGNRGSHSRTVTPNDGRSRIFKMKDLAAKNRIAKLPLSQAVADTFPEVQLTVNASRWR